MDGGARQTRTATLVGSDKGGVGKSLIAQMMVLAYDQAGQDLAVVEIDHQRKLASVMGDRVDLGLGACPSFEEATRDRSLVERFYNPVYETWASRDSVTDLGANVTTPLMEWARSSDVAQLAAEDGLAFRFVAVTTPDDQAIRSACVAVEDARRGLGSDAEIFVVVNDNVGASGFAPFKHTDVWKRLQTTQGTHGVRISEIPYCGSMLMEWGRAMGLNTLDVVKDKDGAQSRIQKAAGLDRLTFNLHARRLGEWVKALQQGIRPFFVEHPRHAAARGRLPA